MADAALPAGYTSQGYVRYCATLLDYPGRPYPTMYHFLLRHGRDFSWRPLPAGLRRGLPRQCFLNAMLLAFRSPNYIYVEGFAMCGGLPAMSMEHAWCVDRKGFVADPTWQEGTDYFGVPFRTKYLKKVALERKSSGVLYNPEMRFPLFTGEHSIEDAIAEVR